MSSKRAISRVICPSAPFLVPRSARTFLEYRPTWTKQYATSTRGPASTSKFLSRVKSQRRRKASPLKEDERSRRVLQQFRSTLGPNSLDEAMRLYPRFVEQSLLQRGDCLAVSLLIHNSYRLAPRGAKAALLPKLSGFADTVIGDLMRRKLPGNPAASVHILSFLKETGQYDKALELWNWLIRQTDDYVDAAVYGAAIEIMAYDRVHNLEEMEALYTQALARFPGNFAAYHLSPNAVVPDRSQPINIWGLPISLLQGILTARILRGDWRGSYLALDTALRLLPTQVPPRFFELFMQERPLSEAYQVFLIACRSGVALRPDRLTTLLTRLGERPKGSFASDKANQTSEWSRLNAMLTAMRAHAGAAGELTGPHISALVEGFSALIPPETVLPHNGQRARLIVETAQTSVDMLVRRGVIPGASVFASLVSLAGKAKIPDAIGVTVGRMGALNIAPNAVFNRTLLLAAGLTGQSRLIETSWTALVEAAEERGEPLGEKDWKALARAARNADHAPYVEEQVSKLAQGVSERIESIIKGELHKYKRDPPVTDAQSEYEKLDSPRLPDRISQVLGRVQDLHDFLQTGPTPGFRNVPTEMSLTPSRAPGTEADLLEIYDELSTDPRQSLPASGGVPKAVSTTGLAFDELRHENWKSINELLLEAEAYEAERHEAIERAIQEGTPLPRGSHKANSTSSEARVKAERGDDARASSMYADLRKRIIRLRSGTGEENAFE